MSADMSENKLKEFILDDDKLVTYTWLSEQLSIHVNVSKQMLWEFWRNNKTKGNISASFVIMGQLADDSERIEVVEESALSSTRGKFQKIYSKHIYSLQKTLPDLQILALVEQPYSRFTSINCKESFFKPNLDLLYSQSETNLSGPKKISLDQRNIESVEKFESKVEEQKVCELPDSSPTDGNKEKANRTVGVKEKTKKVSEKVSKKTVQSLKAGYRNMFGKVVDSNLKRLAIQKEEEKKDVISEKSSSQTEEETETLTGKKETSMRSNEKEKISDTKGNHSKSKIGGKRKVESIKRINKVKKRKRIISESDYSENNSCSSDFEEESKENSKSLENAEECKTLLSSSEANDKSGKRVVRKAEDLRFLDEDGFLVTKKVTVSAEVAVDAIEERPPPSSSCKEVNISRKQTKQSTLTSFFKKK